LVEYDDKAEVTSFLDSTSDSYTRTMDYPSLLVTALNKSTMPPKVLTRWARPDEKLSCYGETPNTSQMGAPSLVGVITTVSANTLLMVGS
jgi:hypothetical protein